MGARESSSQKAVKSDWVTPCKVPGTCLVDTKHSVMVPFIHSDYYYDSLIVFIPQGSAVSGERSRS